MRCVLVSQGPGLGCLCSILLSFTPPAEPLRASAAGVCSSGCTPLCACLISYPYPPFLSCMTRFWVLPLASSRGSAGGATMAALGLGLHCFWTATTSGESGSLCKMSRLPYKHVLPRTSSSLWFQRKEAKKIGAILVLAHSNSFTHSRPRRRPWAGGPRRAGHQTPLGIKLGMGKA